MSKLERIKSGIPGFDEICGGGLIRGRTYLVSGVSGAGKTCFALQFIHHGAKLYDEPGLFVAVEERPAMIRQNASTLGWDLERLEDENKLVMLDMSSPKIGIPSLERYVEYRPFDLNELLSKISEINEQLGLKRAAVDSITALLYHLKDPVSLRLELLKLSTTLEMMGITSIFTREISEEMRGFGIESFIVSGNIMLHYKRLENERLHCIEVYKLRGSSHSNKIHPLEIGPNGLIVHPDQEVYGVF